MKIFIAGDHRGVELKKEIKAFVEELGHTVVDMGAEASDKSCDYPPLAYKVATSVAKQKTARGILLCMTGIGIAIAANKVPGAYAALCYNVEVAKLSRQHNDSNILVLGAKFVSKEEMREIICVWLDEKFEGGRHTRRVSQVKDIEKKFMKMEGKV